MKLTERLQSGKYGIKGFGTAFLAATASLFMAQKYKKGDYILKQGEIGTKVFYIEKGLIRLSTTHKNKEISTWFAKEGDFIFNPKSFHYEVPSHENFQALEDCVVFSISKSMWFQVSTLESVYATYALNELIANLCEIQNHCTILRNLAAEERYEFLITHYPALKGRISQKHLASFLGIDITYLSKIIKKYEKDSELIDE
ncbi:Crp/Fnr family transcriptional regulator [Aquirufa sp. ROCK2-A2]